MFLGWEISARQDARSSNHLPWRPRLARLELGLHGARPPSQTTRREDQLQHTGINEYQGEVVAWLVGMLCLFLWSSGMLFSNDLRWAEPFHTSTLVIRLPMPPSTTATHHVASPNILLSFLSLPHIDMREHLLPRWSPPGTRSHAGRRSRSTS